MNKILVTSSIKVPKELRTKIKISKSAKKSKIYFILF